MSELRVFAQSADTPIDIEAWNAHAVRFFQTKLGFAEVPSLRRAALARNAPVGGSAAAPPPLPPSRSGLVPGQNRGDPAAEPTHLPWIEGSGTTLRTRLVIAPPGAPPGIRSASRRRCDERDFAEAESAEAASGTSGLALLARRCGALWTIDREGAADALALRFAAIVASLVLGPILDPDAKALFGVKTAREKLLAMG